MIARLLSILGLLLCLFGVTAAQTATIDFDTDIPPYTIVSKGMVTSIGCGIPDADGNVNRCLVATATRHSVGQRVGILVTFPQAVSIQSITLDYAMTVTSDRIGYTGGAWDVTIMRGVLYAHAGTVGSDLPFDDTWRTISTEDNTFFAREFWQPRAPFTGNSVLIQVRPASAFHTGATIRIDNIVIDYTP
jgi:hypothetical protein